MLMQNISADRCGEEVGGLKMNARNILAKKREFMIVLSAIALIACFLYGRSVVIESRNSEISVIPSDVCTNFYLGSDDMEDYYRSGKLREQAVKMTDESITPEYHYGYGHGYHRFVTILGQLERYRDTSKEEYYTVMPESAALVILQSAVQNPYTNASGISMTQYSAIYNNEKKTVEVWPFQNYSKSFVFDVTGNRVPAGK